MLAGACILALYATPAYVYFGGAYYASKNGSFHCIAALAIPPYAVYKTGEHHYRNFFPPELDLYEEKSKVISEQSQLFLEKSRELNKRRLGPNYSPKKIGELGKRKSALSLTYLN